MGGDTSSLRHLSDTSTLEALGHSMRGFDVIYNLHLDILAHCRRSVSCTALCVNMTCPCRQPPRPKNIARGHCGHMTHLVHFIVTVCDNIISEYPIRWLVATFIHGTDVCLIRN
jgi:hypothetical protein